MDFNGNSADHDISHGPKTNHNCLGCQEGLQKLKSDFNEQLLIMENRLKSYFDEQLLKIEQRLRIEVDAKVETLHKVLEKKDVSIGNLQNEIGVVKKEKEKIEVDSKQEIYDLRENLRKIAHTNEELENDKKVLKQIVEANEKAKERAKKGKTE